MDGSSASVIAIPIVAMISLAVWLSLVAYAATHPRWKHRQPAAEPAYPRPAPLADDQVTADQPRAA
jgi:hypothetical protein